ncbi:MAG: hypothetical protein LBH82_05165, partial [Bacteroidales bacterium]|nr:hypothetical protein [Bacteroidales bacterium]
MKINLLQRKEIDVEKWNACIVANWETSSVAGMSWYLDKSCDDWNAVIIDDYRTVIPLPYRKKWGIKYVYPPFFASRTGVFGQNLTAEALDTVFNTVSKQFKWIDTMLSPETQININRYRHLKHRAFVMDLQASYAQLKKQYHRNHTRNCRKAINNELTLIKNPDIDAVISLFIDNIAQNGHVGYTPKDYRQLKELLVFLQSNNAAEILGAGDKDG